MDIVVRLLPFVLPPVLGAVIGYVTNALAIKMLFRPLEEKRVLGVRVPLTPGIIPRQRDRLAHSIAKMVSTKLLTEDILLARLRDEEFSSSLEETVSRFTSDILEGTGERVEVDARAPDGAHGVADATEAPVPDEGALRNQVASVLQQLVESFLSSPAFTGIVTRTTETLTSGALRTTADTLLPSNEKLVSLAHRLLDATIDGPAAENAEHVVSRWVTAHLEDDTPLSEIIGETAIERVQQLVPGAYEPALEALMAFLRQDSTRQELSVHGQALLGRVLKRLNLFQRFLVSATQYDKNLRETMPEIIDDVISSVGRAGRNADNRDRLVVALQAKVREVGVTGVRTLLDRFDINAEELVSRLFRLALDLLRRPDVRDRIADAIGRFADRHRDAELGDLVERLTGTSADEFTGRVVEIADRWVGDEENRRRLAERVVSFVGERLSGERRSPLSEILPVSGDHKASIDHFLTVRLQTLVARRVPEIIAGLDVYTMVVNKINGLDMESVENLLLMVIARHLKWINLFGALLGAIIGGIQVVLSQIV